jgi:phosphopentomutase
MSSFKRVFLVVLDACGIGAMPDWKSFGDAEGANTIANVAKYCGGLNLPNLEKLGLANICPIEGLKAQTNTIGVFGKAAELSLGKDTTTGHWEMAGLKLKQPFPVYPEGFPSDVIDEFIKQTGCGGVLGNKPASGTEILVELGEKHLETGWPIVYTSADSVFQIATHTDKVPLNELYRWCELAREILRGQHEVSRVIARPFSGKDKESFFRLSEYRHDYAVKPDGQTILNFLQKHDCETISVGKIKDIFCDEGIDRSLDGKSNEACLKNITDLINDDELLTQNKFIFANLVETDSHFGHRNDPKGFGTALEKIDAALGHWMNNLQDNDLLILTADHGCDPTVTGTDHTREYVPILAYANLLESKDIGTRSSFMDTAASVASWFGLENEWNQLNPESKSFL